MDDGKSNGAAHDRAYGPFVTTSDIQDLKDETRGLKREINCLRGDLTDPNHGLSMMLRENSIASSQLRDAMVDMTGAINRLASLLEAKPA